MHLISVIAALVALVSAPSPPSVKGPRSTTSRAPVFTFASRERGVSPARMRFRCAFDSRRLHRCAARYSQRLAVGRHLLRVQAVDPRGRRSRVTSVKVVVTAPVVYLRPDATITVGARPIGLAFGAGAVWAANYGGGSVSRIDPATGAVTATVDVAGQPFGATYGAGSVWSGTSATATCRASTRRRTV